MDTPVLLIIFNRLDTVKMVVERLREVRPKYVFIAADGPRPGRADEEQRCNEVREWTVSNIDWDCEIKTLFRTQNLGCGRGPSEAITWFFEHVDRGIILEDDCLPEASFFPFCETLLDRYADSEDVYVISGTNYFFNKVKSDAAYYFSNLVFIWGWATWRRAWKKFQYQPVVVEDSLISDRFHHEKYELLMRNNLKHVQNSPREVWDIQWVSQVILNKGKTIIPIKNQVKNIGYVGTHTHDLHSEFFNMPTAAIDKESLKVLPKNTVDARLDQIQMTKICNHEFWDSRILPRIIKRIKRIIS